MSVVITTPKEQESALAIQAEKLYKAVRDTVETEENIGKFICFDVTSADYEVGTDHVQTVMKLKARCPDAQTFTLRIGYETTYSHGHRMKRLPR